MESKISLLSGIVNRLGAFSKGQRRPFPFYLGVSGGFLSIALCPLVLKSQSPPVTSGLVLHLEGDVGLAFWPDGIGVNSWSDQSGWGNKLFARGRPTLEPIATPTGRPAVRFDGADDLLERTYAEGAIQGLPIGSSDRSVFMVSKFRTVGAWSGFAYGSPNFNGAYGLVAKFPGGALALQGWGCGNDLVSEIQGVEAGWTIESATLLRGLSRLFVNGSEAVRFRHRYQTGNTRIVIGEEISGRGLSGMDVAAVLVYNRGLSSAERQNVERYLQNKYIATVPDGAGSVDESDEETGRVILFDGENLNGFSVWTAVGGWLGEQSIFTVQDGLLRIASEVPYAGLISDASYSDYEMTLEYKWGAETFGERAGLARDSGLLLHSRGPADGWRGRLMPNIEVQIMEGSTGDFILLKGAEPMRLSSKIENAGFNSTWNYRGGYVWSESGTTKTFSRDLESVHWCGWDSSWTDVAGFRGKDDFENPVGEWNRLVVVASGDRLEVFLNGVKVNEAFDVFPSSGRIQLESEQAELMVRHWELRFLPPVPASETTRGNSETLKWLKSDAVQRMR